MKSNIKKLVKKIESSDLLEPAKVSNATVAGGYIFDWVLAVRDSSYIFEEVKLLKERAAEIKAIYDKQNAEL